MQRSFLFSHDQKGYDPPCREYSPVRLNSEKSGLFNHIIENGGT
jgi:hypothetical protein